MSNFVRVKDLRYADDLLLNVDNITYISLNSGHVLLNGTHAEGNGVIRFNQENIQIILNAINQGTGLASNNPEATSDTANPPKEPA
jgi:hypothetical protein